MYGYPLGISYLFLDLYLCQSIYPDADAVGPTDGA